MQPFYYLIFIIIFIGFYFIFFTGDVYVKQIQIGKMDTELLLFLFLFFMLVIITVAFLFSSMPEHYF